MFCPMTTPLEYLDSFSVALFAPVSTATDESVPTSVFEESRLTYVKFPEPLLSVKTTAFRRPLEKAMTRFVLPELSEKV